LSNNTSGDGRMFGL